ncbi:hypothetical protein JCM10213_007532 [Rhodosporidiobolus nylandii]
MESFNGSERYVATDRTGQAIRYLSNGWPAVWDYSEATSGFAPGGNVGRDVALLPYAVPGTALHDGSDEPVYVCAIQGFADRSVEAAHILPESCAFDALKQAGVIPHFAAHHLPSNIISFSKAIHDAFDSGSLRFLPTLEAVLVRLAGEYAYYSSIHSHNLPISRPPFSLFYDELEHDPAIVEIVAVPFRDWQDPILWYLSPIRPRLATNFKIPFFAKDETDPVYANLPPYPPVLLPISTNLLIFAMRDRCKQRDPAPLHLQQSSTILDRAVELLTVFWLGLGQRNLVTFLDEVKQFVLSAAPPGSTYIAAFLQPGFSPSALSSPPPPAVHRDSRSAYSPPYPATSRVRTLFDDADGPRTLEETHGTGSGDGEEEGEGMPFTPPTRFMPSDVGAGERDEVVPLSFGAVGQVGHFDSGEWVAGWQERSA